MLLLGELDGGLWELCAICEIFVKLQLSCEPKIILKLKVELTMIPVETYSGLF